MIVGHLLVTIKINYLDCKRVYMDIEQLEIFGLNGFEKGAAWMPEFNQ